MKFKMKGVLVFLVILGLSRAGLASGEVIDRIVAIVGNDMVTLTELNKEASPYLRNLESAGYSDEKKDQMKQTIYKKILDALIDRSLTQQEATKYHIAVSESEINTAVANFKKSKGIDQQEFEAALVKEGLTLKDYRENIRKQILQAKLINQTIKSKVIITESEIKQQYEADAVKYAGTKKYHLRNILMNSPDEIQVIKKKLDKKQKFASLAKQYSIAPNAPDGGDLGVFDIHNFSKPIKDSISKLNKKGHTDVISTAQGFQIFYVEDIVLEGSKTYEQAFEEIQKTLYAQQVEKNFKAWLEALKKKAHIKIML